MARQTLKCRKGKHVWTRDSQRGKPPQDCPDHKENATRQMKATVLSISVDNVPETESTTLEGVALCDRLMANLASRGQLISQQRSHVYAGPRY